MSDRGLVIFDLETTGLDPEVDRIVQIAVIKYPKVEGAVMRTQFVKVLNPCYPIDPGASEVHGFTYEDVKDAPTFKEEAEYIKESIGDSDLGGHNIIAFDVPLLMKEFERAGVPFSIEDRRLIDSLEIFRYALPHTLEAALTFFTGKSLDCAHDALCDAKASSDVIFAELKEYDLSLDKAHEISMGDRLTLDGKIIKGEYGPVLNFGKSKGMYLSEVARDDAGFLMWVLKKEFSAETKEMVSRALRGDFPLPSEAN